tara:strand:+ start:272 stop:748 length:477 start_codon:yes stop_codon:yes gene_type:complete
MYKITDVYNTKTVLSPLTLPTDISREGIVEYQEYLQTLPGGFDLPVQHTFSDGVYAREAFLPKDSIVVGKIHRHGHLNIISRGKVVVVTEFGIQHLEGPITFVSKPGTKRVVRALEDTQWTTIHLNESNTQDLAELEKQIIATSYEQLEGEILWLGEQ